MKKSARLWLVPLSLGAVISGVNWKLNHPPLTRADTQFARLVQGADEVEITTFGGRGKATLKDWQLAQLLADLRFENAPGLPTQGYDAYYTLTWKKKGAILNIFDADFEFKFPALWQTIASSNSFNHQMNARSGRRLAARLSQLVPVSFR